METEMKLPKGIEGDLTSAQFDEVCSHFGCTLQGKTRFGEWIITTDDTANLYWLGANMALRIETPLSVSYVNNIVKRKR